MFLFFSQANFSCFHRRYKFSSFKLSHLYHTISLYMFESGFPVWIISFVGTSLSVIKHQLHLQEQPKDSPACGRMWKGQWSRDHWAFFEKFMLPRILVSLSPLYHTPVSKFLLEKICAQNPEISNYSKADGVREAVDCQRLQHVPLRFTY